jgi:hypothetical protein
MYFASAVDKATLFCYLDVWGTDIPRVHWKDKRHHERLEGPIIRKVIPS